MPHDATATPAPAPPDAPGRPIPAALTIAAVALAAMACFRATLTFDPFPYFSADPFLSFAQITSLTPADALWIDAASLLLAAACIALHRVAGGTLRRPLLLLGVLGSLATLFWSLGVRGPDIDHARRAFATLAAFWTAIGLAHACADPRRRALCLAVLLGVALMMVAKGLVQVLVEHPDTLAWYRRDPDAFLRAQGWEPGSAQARAYERRLRQPEATGWFGLSNILATVLAGAAVGLGAMAAAALARRDHAAHPRPTIAAPVALALAALLCLIGLLLSGSKGGMAAALGGAIATALLGLAPWWMSRRARRASRPAPATVAPVALAAALVAAPLVGVIVRGLIGERIGELSILFRWFYMQGAARIIADHPLLGVGPAGFRDAYVLVKPPLAVEDVTSPHCFPLDLLASYGVPAGAALLAIVILLAAGAIRAALHTPDPAKARTPTPTPSPPADTKALALVLILATIAASFIERPLLTPEIALARLAGLALWIAAAWGVLTLAARSPRALALGAAGAACVLVLHAGIEMTPIWPNAQAWFLALLGVVGAGGTPAIAPAPATTTSRKPRRWPALAALALWTALCLLAAPWRILEWQSLLRQSWLAAAPVGQLRADMDLVTSEPRLAQDLGITPESIRAELARLVNQPPAPTPAQFERQLTLLVQSAATAADGPLQRATYFDHLDTLRARDRTAQHRITALVEMGDPDFGLSVLTETIARTAFAVSRLDAALAWSHLASLDALRADLLDQLGRAEDARAARALAIDHYTRAAARDPRGLFHAVRIARLSASIGDQDGARRWARQALENHAQARLDPVMGLSDAELSEMGRLGRDPGSPPPGP